MNKFLEKAVIPILVAFVSPIATAIASKIKTGEWVSYFERIPPAGYYIFFGIIAIWLILALIRKRVLKIRRANSHTGPMFSSAPTWGYIDFAEIELFDVKWRIKAPAPAPYSMEGFDPDKVPPGQIDIDTPPRCPKCGTELEEKKNFWGVYNWDCVACGFRTSNNDSYYTVSDKVERIVKRQMELKNEKK